MTAAEIAATCELLKEPMRTTTGQVINFPGGVAPGAKTALKGKKKRQQQIHWAVIAAGLWLAYRLIKKATGGPRYAGG